MYESAFVGIFFRLWGNNETSEDLRKNVLLCNAQNKFDATFGDVNAQINERYFIVEFKKTREGVAQEVRAGGKDDRQELLANLLKQQSLRELSVLCHFAAYGESDTLFLETYMMACADECVIPNILESTPLTGLAHTELIGKISFLDFFNKITTKQNEIHEQSFVSGLGLSKADFKLYVQGMYLHKQGKGTLKERVLLGKRDRFGNFHINVRDWEELILELEINLIAAQVVQGNSASSSVQPPPNATVPKPI